MYSGAFWKDAFERAVKSAAQAVVLTWGVGDQMLDLFAIDGAASLSFALGGFVLSILTSVISAPIGEKGTASLVS